jgi:hypothetical protein
MKSYGRVKEQLHAVITAAPDVPVPQHHAKMAQNPLDRKLLTISAASYPMGTGSKADNSPPTSAEVKNAWGYTSTIPPYIFMVWCSVKHRVNSTFAKN